MSGPRAGPGKERIRADTQVGPYRVDCNTQQAQRNGRGRSPAPTGLPGVPSSGPMYLRHDLRPYGEKGTPNRPSGSAAQSGASAAWMGGMGGHRGRDHPQSVQQPRTIPQSRQSRDSSLYTREPWPAGDGADIARPSEFPAAPGGAGQSPPPTRTPRVPICGPMYLRHGFRRPNFVPKCRASVIGIGPYERTRGYGFPRRFAPRNDSTNAGSRSAGPSSTSFSARRSVRNDRRRQSFQLSSYVSTSFVTTRSEAPAPVSPKSPVNSGKVSKGRAEALPLVVSRGSGDVFFSFEKNTSPAAAGPRPLAAQSASRAAKADGLPRHPRRGV